MYEVLSELDGVGHVVAKKEVVTVSVPFMVIEADHMKVT